MATVSALLPRNMIAVAGLARADMHELARVAGVALDELHDPDARIQHERLVDLWEAITSRVADDDFGLHFAEHSRRQRDNVLAYAAASCATVEDALRCGTRYSALVDEALVPQLLTDGDLAGVRMGVAAEHRSHRHGMECGLAITWMFVQQSARFDGPTAAVHFTHARPRATNEHRRLFGIEPTFGALGNEIWFARTLLAHPLPPADPELFAHLDRYLQRMLAALAKRDDAFVQRVRRILAESMRVDAFGIIDVAARMHMSRRHLQRRLRDAGTSFQLLLDGTRHDLAMRYLDEPQMTLSEVGFLLGFAEPSTFHRAFKRWTGLTPAEARRRRRDEVARRLS